MNSRNMWSYLLVGLLAGGCVADGEDEAADDVSVGTDSDADAADSDAEGGDDTAAWILSALSQVRNLALGTCLSANGGTPGVSATLVPCAPLGNSKTWRFTGSNNLRSETRGDARCLGGGQRDAGSKVTMATCKALAVGQHWITSQVTVVGGLAYYTVRGDRTVNCLTATATGAVILARCQSGVYRPQLWAFDNL
jgi:Ricin-type beta-trefoil lectin domain